MLLNRMAWRNLRRNKRRTLISAFSVAFGIFLSVTFTGSGDYSYTRMVDTSAAMGLGHISIQPAGYDARPSLALNFADADRVAATVRRLEGVEQALVRITGQAMFAAGAKSAGGSFLAIDPDRETPAYNFFLRAMVAGHLFAATDGRGAVIGRKLAEKLKLRLGRRMIITLTDKNGELTSELTRVRGIFATGDQAMDSGLVLLPLGRIRATLNYDGHAANLVAVYLRDQRRVDQLAQRIDQALSRPDLEILPWSRTQADLAGLIAVDRLFNYLLQFLVGLVIAAGIMNTLLMSVLERHREFGIMMAVGMSPRQVEGLVLVESFWLALLGLAMGVAITTPWFLYLHQVGIDFSGLLGNGYQAGGVLVDPVMKIRLYRESVLAILAGVFALTMGGGVYPAIRAGRIPPVESIREI